MSRVLNTRILALPNSATEPRLVVKSIVLRKSFFSRPEKPRQVKTIGIMVPDACNPIAMACVRTAQDVFRKNGFMSILAFSSGKEEMEAREIADFMLGHIDGLLLMPSAARPSWLEKANHPLNIVAFDRPLDGEAIDSVLVENRIGSVEGVKHLLAHGHKHIVAVCDNSDLYTTRQRAAGYCEAMIGAGLSPELVTLSSDPASATNVLRNLVIRNNAATAIFALSGVCSMKILKAVAELGIKVPDDLAILGFDDLDHAEMLCSPLTVIRQPLFEIGERAANLLMNRVMSSNIDTTEHLVLPVQLVVRNSCGCTA